MRTAGSSRSHTALITATPCAPAETTGAIEPTSIPPMAITGGPASAQAVINSTPPAVMPG